MAPQVWLITGTTSGFGAEFVKKLLAKGHKVIATARNTSKIAHFKEAGASILALDLFSEQVTFDKVAADAVAIHGHVDVVVNNAGYSHFGIIEDDSREDWIKQYQTHVFGTFGVARAFLPHFRARKAGTFVFIGSTAAWGGIPTLGAYCGSKSALRGAVETLNLETKPLGIRNLLVEPGFFRTELLNDNNVTYVDTKFEDYKPVTEPLFTTFKKYHQQQPGDPAKGVQRIIDTVLGENDAAGKEFPVSLALGSDAVEQIRKKCEETLKLLDEWEAVSSNTNYD
ncbi:related to ketoreductases [Phialocephala subalpina]|uniref:Related to ketoreductases n=1 Tax=Phialocephala subalpina TaxID=576137 RepID=A0A1L7WYC3_9HELO|nr:related to ketoreductases [Phialocephala subalpina]